MEVHITYLDYYTKQLTHLVNELLDTQDRYDVTADLEQVEKLSNVLEELKTVVDNLPLA